MLFKLILVPANADTFIHKSEPVLSGTSMVSIAEGLYHKSLEDIYQWNYINLGNITTYTINVPKSIATESQKFTTTDSVVVKCPEDFLSSYTHYMAHYTTNNISENSNNFRTITVEKRINELDVLAAWVESGYTAEFSKATT